MWKKRGALLLVLCMVFMSACSGNNEPIKAEQPASQTPSASQETSAPSTVPEPEPTVVPDKDPVTIKFMNYTSSGSQEKTLSAMVVEFEKANPDVKVIIEVTDYANYFTKLNTLLASGAAPDVFEVGFEDFRKYASKGLLLDLTPSITADTSFKPDTYKKLAYDAFNFEGKQMGVTESYSAVVMYYNKDLFDAKGVAYPDASWTWKEELDAAKKLTDPAAGVWGTFAPVQFYEFYKTIAQNGGSAFDESGNLTLNSPANVEAFQWMLDKANVHKVSPPFTDDIYAQPDADLNAFVAGKLAMARFGTWNIGRFAEASFKWDIALEPGNTQKAHHFFADGLVASNKTEHADAVWRFIKFMSGDPLAVGKRIESGWGIPAITDETVMAAYYGQTPPESKKLINEALDSLVTPPVGPQPEKWSAYSGEVGKELDKAKLGRMNAQEALDSAQKAAQKELDK